MSSEVPKTLGIALYIIGFGVFLYVIFGPTTGTFLPQLQQLIWPLLVVSFALMVGGASLYYWPFRSEMKS